MSARYYWISFAIVFALTVLISWVKQTRTRKEFFKIMLAVTIGFLLVVAVVAGLAKLLAYWGIAESGFIF